MTGFCPYIKGSLKESECHHDGYCSDCPHNTKDDTISRQAAIDAFYLQADDDGWWCGTVEDTEKLLKSLPPAQPEQIQNNSVHLCDSCQYTYTTCPSHDSDAIFGDGKYNSNICACNKYRPISAQPERKWIPCSNPPKHHRDVLVRGNEAIGNVTVHKVMQWDVDTWRPTDYAPSIRWEEWSEI